MTRPAKAADPSQKVQPGMVRVQILADAFVYEGYVHLLAGGRLVQDLLNNEQPFLNLTDVVILDRAAASTIHVPYVALNKGAITHVVPLANEARDVGPPPVPLPVVPTSTGLSPAAQAAAKQPTLPSSGPKTVPSPPPPTAAAKVRLADGPTQPYERFQSGDDLDLDDDDLDLDDD